MSGGNTIPGLHHVTAIASDPQTNVDFYAGTLGLRLVKKTVNYDDPGTYHLYYGDAVGSPGTILTFFPWPGAQPGRRGTGETTAIALSVPDEALNYWTERLRAHGTEVEGPHARFNEQFLSFADPDGMALELVARLDGPNADARAWTGGGVPAGRAIRGLDVVTILVAERAPTETLLIELGFRFVANENGRLRYVSGDETAHGHLVDVVVGPGERRGSLGAGTVHHIAWRTPDDASQARWLSTLTGQNRNVSPVMDRQYFHSIYFREPGGVLFEIATDPPGFLADESPDALGTSLRLPAWAENQRAQLEQRLAPLRVPAAK